jgi:hypothetical protein
LVRPVTDRRSCFLRGLPSLSSASRHPIVTVPTHRPSVLSSRMPPSPLARARRRDGAGGCPVVGTGDTAVAPRKVATQLLRQTNFRERPEMSTDKHPGRWRCGERWERREMPIRHLLIRWFRVRAPGGHRDSGQKPWSGHSAGGGHRWCANPKGTPPMNSDCAIIIPPPRGACRPPSAGRCSVTSPDAATSLDHRFVDFVLPTVVSSLIGCSVHRWR